MNYSVLTSFYLFYLYSRSISFASALISSSIYVFWIIYLSFLRPADSKLAIFLSLLFTCTINSSHRGINLGCYFYNKVCTQDSISLYFSYLNSRLSVLLNSLACKSLTFLLSSSLLFLSWSNLSLYPFNTYYDLTCFLLKSWKANVYYRIKFIISALNKSIGLWKLPPVFPFILSSTNFVF